MHRLKKIFLILAVAPAFAGAQQLASTNGNVELHAGPAQEYPVVAVLPGGVTITVEGCVSDYTWCDVVAGTDRGWAYAGNIIYAYQGAPVPLLSYGSLLGVGIVGFSVGSYWDNHYRSRPWYPDRQRWIDGPQPRFGARPPGGRNDGYPRLDDGSRGGQGRPGHNADAGRLDGGGRRDGGVQHAPTGVVPPSAGMPPGSSRGAERPAHMETPSGAAGQTPGDRAQGDRSMRNAPDAHAGSRQDRGEHGERGGEHGERGGDRGGERGGQGAGGDHR